VIGSVSSLDVPGYARTYFPGTPIPAEAQFVSIGRGETLAGIDVMLARVHTARIAGQLLSATGEPTTGGTVLLAPSQRSRAMTTVPVGARILPNRQFEFANVPAGAYVIRAYRGRRNNWTEGEFGALTVDLGDEDVTGLVLHASSGSSISGRLSFETVRGSKEPLASAIAIEPIPVDDGER